jgi:hypothetical protein
MLLPPIYRRVAVVGALSVLAVSTACKKKAPEGAVGGADAGKTAKPPPPPPPPPAPVLHAGDDYQRACYDLAKTRCAKVGLCPHSELVDGNLMSCLPRTVDRCLYELAPKYGGVAVADIDKCKPAQKTASCAPTSPADLSACGGGAPGTFADGKACTTDRQCQGLFCARPAGQNCGKCESAPKEGEDCKDGRCGGTDLSCVENKCVHRQDKGGACTTNASCHMGLVCSGGKCADGLKAAAKCNPDADACDPVALLGCEGESKTCKPLAAVATGEACGVKGSLKRCRAEDSCIDGKCVTRLARGKACAPSGPPCEPPLTCVEGKCGVADVDQCK